MKKVLLAITLVALCLLFTVACMDFRANEASETHESSYAAECEHNWERIGNLNESTARDECTKCGEIRLYTDPESLPEHYNFSGLFYVSAIEQNTGFLDCYSRAVLDILNRGLWEKEIVAGEFDYIFKINGHELYYDEESGVFANFAENRQMCLTDSEKDSVTSLLGDVFLVDFETPDVLIRIEKWNGKGFEGVVADPLISYLEIGDKVMVELCDGVAVDEGEFPVGALAKVRFAWFDASVDPDLLFAEAVTAQGFDEVNDFSFSLIWNTYGISSYDSESGVLIKSTDSLEPEKFVTSYHLTDEDKRYIWELIQSLDVNSYPNLYNPNEGVMSEPCMSLILTVRSGETVKTVAAENIAITYESEDEKGQRFLSTCRAIEELLTSTEAWKKLPEYDVFYD